MRGCIIFLVSPPSLAELLLADGGESVSGKFLFRQKKSENDLILSCIYKGSATHHKLLRETDGGEWSLNKQATGCATLVEVMVSAAAWPRLPSLRK